MPIHSSSLKYQYFASVTNVYKWSYANYSLPYAFYIADVKYTEIIGTVNNTRIKTNLFFRHDTESRHSISLFRHYLLSEV